MKQSDRDRGEVFLSLVRDHSSVRSFVPGAEVPPGHVDAIIAAAQRASTSCNLQTYAFMSITRPQTRRRLAELAGGHAGIVEAGLFLIVCIDLHKTELVARKAGYRYTQARYLESFLMASIDAALAAQNASLAAESLGYGICMIGSLRNQAEEVWKILELPPKVFPLFGMTVGVPARRNPPKPRLPLAAVLFHDRYDERAVEKAVEEYDTLMANSGVYSGREIDPSCCAAAGPSPVREEYGWIEHSARRISSTDPLQTRAGLRGVLEQAGFSFD
jgi:FMN reductase (NADPH)